MQQEEFNGILADSIRASTRKCDWFISQLNSFALVFCGLWYCALFTSHFIAFTTVLLWVMNLKQF
jgi:hypothetical protein